MRGAMFERWRKFMSWRGKGRAVPTRPAAPKVERGERYGIDIPEEQRAGRDEMTEIGKED